MSSAADFTVQGYRAILERALALGYAVQAFESFRLLPDRPVLLLRHDLDHSLRAALPLAHLEAELTISSTYFVQVTCDFYNVLGTEGRALIAQLAGLGHEIGLHYNSRRYIQIEKTRGIDAAAKALRLDIALLEDLSGRPIVSASQHLPIDTEPFDVSMVVRNEAYENRFMSHGMQYVSDSLLTWRGVTPHDLLDQQESFQFLAHPVYWGPTASGLSGVLAGALNEECAALRQSYLEVESYYSDLLRRRSSLDAQFKARRYPLPDAPL